MRTWGEEEAVDEVTLLTSELVTNAVLHARSSIEVAVEQRRSGVRVEVRDASKEEPVRRHVSEEATFGRGLALIEAIASRWGIRRIPDDGKAVWFELATGTS